MGFVVDVSTMSLVGFELGNPLTTGVNRLEGSTLGLQLGATEVGSLVGLKVG